MPLTKSKGQMYPWVTHTHSHLAGKCPHGCSYCYVQAMTKRFPNMAERYSGPVRLIESELKVNYGSGKTIFIDHMNDLFAEAVPMETIERVIGHCNEYPGNTYVFQTKNPERYSDIGIFEQLPSGAVLGTTIESQYFYPEIMHGSPRPVSRYMGMLQVQDCGFKLFVTIEPVLKFDLDTLLSWICELRPDFVNIGADSKGIGLPEPSGEELHALIDALKKTGIEIRQKHNLLRLLPS